MTRLHLPFILRVCLLLSFAGCAPVHMYENSLDKLDERLSMPMTKEQVFSTLGKPDKVIRDDGHTLVGEYRLYPRGQWLTAVLLCPVTLFVTCVFPAQDLHAFKPEPHYVVLIDDQLCMWGPKEVVLNRKTCKTSMQATGQSGEDVVERMRRETRELVERENRRRAAEKEQEKRKETREFKEKRARAKAETEAIKALKVVGLDASYLDEVYREVDYIDTREPEWWDKTPPEEQFNVLAQRVLARVRKAQSAEQVPPQAMQSPQLQESAGSGFLVSLGYVVTNEHIVRGMTRLSVHHEGESYSASVVYQDAANDIAVLKLSKEVTRKMAMVLEGPASVTGLRMGNVAAVRQGDRVWTLGFPLSSLLGEQAVLTEGTVSSLSGVGGNPRFFMITVPIQPGNSGGPLLNERGEVIGITMSTLDVVQVFQLTGTIPQNLNFAIKISYAQPLLSQLPGLEFLIPNASPSKFPLSLPSLAEAAKPHIVLIKASR